jgi:hypothetical protein
VSRGKEFEAQLRAALRRDWPKAWVERFTDAMTGRGMSSVKSPPDLIAVGVDEHALLIECKATKGKSIPFDRVDGHQLDHLLRFSAATPLTDRRTHGCVALLQYNGERGKARLYRAWLLPVDQWAWLGWQLPRKSLPFDHPYLHPYEMRWVPGHGWVTTDAIERVLRPTG